MSISRLSVIIPTFNRKGMTEKAVVSVLKQTDPVGTEIIIADDGSTDGTSSYFKESFPDEVRSGKIVIATFDRTGDPGKTRNQAVTLSQGSFLAFLDPEDSWKPGRLQMLEPLLKKHDLILSTNEPLSLSSDWMQAFLQMNWATSSSAIIRRTLFEETGGFPEGFSGRFLPRRIPGVVDYEFWLKCIALLLKTERKERFILIQNEHVEVGKRLEDLLPVEAQPALRMLKAAREVVTLMHVAPSIPKRYWPVLGRRLAGLIRNGK